MPCPTSNACTMVHQESPDTRPTSLCLRETAIWLVSLTPLTPADWGAEDWFLEVRAREQEVREKTPALRQKRVDRWNKRHREPPVFGPDKGPFWYRHQPNRSSSLDAGWVGPLDFRSRIGETSYQLWTGFREFRAHASMMEESTTRGLGLQWPRCPI